MSSVAEIKVWCQEVVRYLDESQNICGNEMNVPMRDVITAFTNVSAYMREAYGSPMVRANELYVDSSTSLTLVLDFMNQQHGIWQRAVTSLEDAWRAMEAAGAMESLSWEMDQALLGITHANTEYTKMEGGILQIITNTEIARDAQALLVADQADALLQTAGAVIEKGQSAISWIAGAVEYVRNYEGSL